MSSPFLQALRDRVIVFDGAMGSTLQSHALSIEEDYLGHENCVDLLVRSRPELIRSLHESFLEAGADVVETDTFGANKLVFAEFGDELVGWTRDLNSEAARLARAACDRFSTPGRPRFVAGSMGPGTKLISLGQTTWSAMLESYLEQVRGLIEGGVDCFIIETAQDLLQVKCAVSACLAGLEEAGLGPDDLPILVSVTIETTGTMLLGTEIAAAANALSMYPIAALGLNCATGPTEMGEHIAYLAHHWPRPISVIPNAGLPVLVAGHTEFPLGPAPFAESLLRFVEELGVGIVGGCYATSRPSRRGAPACTRRSSSSRTTHSSSSRSEPTPTAHGSSSGCWRTTTGTAWCRWPATRSATAPTCWTCAWTTSDATACAT
jgi:5-methyltetrahydrofolate--homocysteine methyltransferase